MFGTEKSVEAKRLTWLLLALSASCLSLKLFFGFKLDLYSDEVFYWLASTKPSLAYSDLPFITALLAGIGSSIENGSALAVRIPFILLGSSLPFLVYWIAKPITGSQQAQESAVLSLCLPLGGFLGLLAVPDVPLIFFGLLSIGSFERALRTNGTRYWVFTGIAVAFGLSTHYRFILYPAAAFLFLCIFTPVRSQWKNPKLWFTIIIASLGLIPIIWFNLSNQLSSASFYFVDRHPWSFQASGLFHIFKQAGLVTPPLYVFFLYTLILLWRKSKEGDMAPALLFSFASVNLLVYMVLAPWSDANSTSIHWPLSGYFPLLIYVPYAFHHLNSLSHSIRQKTWLKRTAIAVPTLGFLGTLTALGGVGSQAFQNELQSIVGAGVLSNKMAGWKEFSATLKEIVGERPGKLSLISDNYYTAAQIEFAGLSDFAFTLDQDKAVRDGRITQFHLWEKDLAALTSAENRAFLFVTEDSTLNTLEKEAVLNSACSIAESMNWAQELVLFNGDKRFSFYEGKLLSNIDDDLVRRANPCPFSPRAWIDTPLQGDTVSGKFQISGWAINQDLGIEEVTAIVDGQRFELNYGDNRSDVIDALPTQTLTDPNRPNFGFNGILDSREFSNGSHTLAIELLSSSGLRTSYGARSINITNADQ